MSRKPEEYVVEFEDRPGRWVPIAGEVYRRKGRAEARSVEAAKELGARTRVAPRKPIWEEWSFRKLATRMGGTAQAAREMKKRTDRESPLSERQASFSRE